MATENVGGIQYTVDADTAAMLKAEAVVNKSSSSMSKSLKGADTSVKQFNTTVTKSASGVQKAMKANLGQAGIQVQQFVGQLQGGQSAMVALAQQSADLGIVLGAPMIGVIVSLAAVLAGTLAPAIFGSTSNIEKLQKAIENTKAIMTIGAGGIVEYTAEMQRLNEVSQNLAKIKIALAMTQNAEAMKAAKKEASALREELFGFQEYASDAAERLTGLASNQDQIVGLATAMRNFNSAASDEEKLKALSEAEKILLSLRKDGAFPTKDLAKYAQQFFEFSEGVRTAVASNEALSKSNEKVIESSGKSTSSIGDITNALLSQRIELEEGERAAFAYNLQLQGLTESEKEAALALYDHNEEIKKNQAETKEATEANEKYEKSVRSKTESDLAWYEQQLAQQNQKDTQATATLTTQVQNIGLTPEEEIQARYDAEIELLRQAEENKIEIEGTYAERRTQLEKERLESVRALQSENNEFLEAAFGNLDTQIAGTMASVVMGAQDGESALKSLATTILTQVVGAIIQQGIASVFASQTAAKGQTVANAEILATAAPAASAVSLATAGANSFPAVAGIAAVSAAMAGISSIAGAREFGGPVTAGKSYLVGERGPEMFTPGTSGGIVSNSDMSGGSGVSVNINNYSGQEVTQNYDEVKKIVTVEIGKQISGIRKGTSQMSKAMKGTMTTKGRATKV